MHARGHSQRSVLYSCSLGLRVRGNPDTEYSPRDVPSDHQLHSAVAICHRHWHCHGERMHGERTPFSPCIGLGVSSSIVYVTIAVMVHLIFFPVKLAPFKQRLAPVVFCQFKRAIF